MINPDAHRSLREQLGAFALGHLDEVSAEALQAHLDGCAECRAELADIRPVVEALANIDVSNIENVPAPPPGLGDAIRRQVAAERAADGLAEVRQLRSSARRRASTHLVRLAAAAALVVAAVGVGAAIGRTTAPQPVAVPLEAIELEPVGGSALTITSANLVAHTWGVEVRFAGSGFVRGEVYRAAVRDASGVTTPAGEFIGTGDSALVCQMQSAQLRDDAVAFVVLDDSGDSVLAADLSPGS